ncbi:MAG TPA: DUF1571 domain-containing protein [Pirellulales bacterium]|nr:DUF1571 domain-containing protein [Pirellulales bacterium]
MNSQTAWVRRGVVVASGVWLWASAGLAQPPANRPAAAPPPGGQRVARQTAPRLECRPPANQPLANRSSSNRPTSSRPALHPPAVAEAIRQVEISLKALEQVDDYSCVLVKRERIGGSLSANEHLAIKLRHDPYSVYVRYLSPDRVRGQEAIYVHGLNQNHLLAHPNGLTGRLVRMVKLDPLGKRAMEGNRYPITELGVKRLAESWLKEARHDVQFVACDAKTMRGAKLDGKACTCVELTRRQRHHDLPYQMTRLFIDAESQFPIRYEAYEWSLRPGGEPELAEEYTYRDIQPNCRFVDLDFDAQNSEYGFR